ncbi:MAG: tetratricopeptide repeat protein, partial [Methylocystis sp.]
DNPDIAVSLNNLAQLYMHQGRYTEAETDYKRAVAIWEKSLGAESPTFATGLVNLASIYDLQGLYAEGRPLLERALAIKEKRLGSEHPDVMLIVNNLALLDVNQTRYAEAESLYKRALAAYEKVLGPDHLSVATSLSNLGSLYHRLGRYAEAEPLYQRALAIKERTLGPQHLDVALILSNLATFYVDQGRYADAETLHKRALAVREKVLGAEHPDIGTNLDNLAALYDLQGRNAEAEQLYKRALTLREKALGAEHPDVALSLDHLGGLYDAQGRYAEAEALYKRTLQIAEKRQADDSPALAVGLNNLALHYERAGRYGDAEPLYRRALAIREQAFGPDSPNIATNLNNFAALLEVRGRTDEAEKVYKRALDLQEKTLGSEHPGVAVALNNLALLNKSRGAYAKAEGLYQRALAIWQKALGPEHANVATALSNLATDYGAQGRLNEALDAARRSVEIRVARIVHSGADRAANDVSERRSARISLLALLSLLAAQAPGGAIDPKLVDEAFRAAQYVGGVDTAQALAGMTARFAAGSDALAALVRDRQDLLSRWRALDGLLTEAVSQAPSRRSAEAEAALRKEMTEIEAKLASMDERLRIEFPLFSELSSARPATLADIQSVLAKDEALVLWTIGEEEGFLFVVRRDRSGFFRIGRTAKQFAEDVRKLRDALDVAKEPDARTPHFDAGRAHQLYNFLVKPAEALLADAKSLIIVPGAALQSLPPSVLVTEARRDARGADYAQVAWLAKRYALSVVPAASSLTSLRRFAEPRRPKRPFVGFGDPDFMGGGATGVVARGAAIAKLYRGGGANLQELRKLPRLPETADELHAEAEALGAPRSSVYLGRYATVTTVKGLDLTDTRVVAFATHGLIAGDMPTLSEPALALTPPAVPSGDDDGLLRASEIAKLRINADWVVLSACNTAAADGSPGAEGLSGLAKAFFYAGARSLLVSHWSVSSDATVKLTTTAFAALQKDPEMGRAEAFRRSMLSMIDAAGKSKKTTRQAHPYYWAPFVVVGEGGAGR